MTKLAEVLELSVDERIKLVEVIWDSITEFPDSVTLSNEQKDELDDRMNDYYNNPDSGSNWSEVRERIEKYK